MAFVSVKSMVIARTCILWSLAYYFVTDPTSITESNFVVVMARSMELPLANLRYDNPLIGLVALLLILLGVADLPPLAGDYILYFENALLYRLFAYFGIAGYSYFVYSPLLSNSLVFCFSFLELVLNFVIYATLREERNDINGEQLRFIVEEEEEEETLEEL